MLSFAERMAAVKDMVRHGNPPCYCGKVGVGVLRAGGSQLQWYCEEHHKQGIKNGLRR